MVVRSDRRSEGGNGTAARPESSRSRTLPMPAELASRPPAPRTQSSTGVATGDDRRSRLVDGSSVAATQIGRARSRESGSLEARRVTHLIHCTAQQLSKAPSG
jgi:hypothetical protein